MGTESELDQLESSVFAPAVASGRWQCAPAHVLVADDSPEDRELLRIVLDEHGLQSYLAEDGQQALDILARKRMDLVLMDVQMPVMEGYKAVGHIREQGLTLPVIALAAHAMKGVKDQCLEPGFTDYRSKPVSFDELLARVAKDLEAQWVEPEEVLSNTATGQSAAGSLAAESAGHAGGVLRSSLPTEGGKFDKIIGKFVIRLQQQVQTMRSAFEEREYELLKDLGHWMKGSPGSVGFHDFDQPGIGLEQYAIDRDDEGLATVLEVLERLSARVTAAYPEGAAMPVSDASVVTNGASRAAADSPLPSVVKSDMAKDPRFRPLVEKFVVRLPAQLDSIEHAIGQGDFKQVKDIAHWLKGTAGTVGLHDFTVPATELEELAGAGDGALVTDKLFFIRELHNRIKLDDNVAQS